MRSPCRVVSAGGSASRPRRAYRCAHLVESSLQVAALLVRVVRIDALTLSSRFCRWQRFSSESCVSMRSPCRVVSAGGSASRRSSAYRCAHLVEPFLQVAALLVRVVRIDALTLSSRFCRWQRFSSASCVSMRSPCRVVSAGGSASRRSSAYRCAHLVESFLQVAALLVRVVRIDALTLSSRFCRWQRFSSESCVSMRSPCRVVSAGGSASRRSHAYRCAHLVESFLQVVALLVGVVRIDALTLSSRFCRWQRFSSASCVSMRSPCRVVSAGGSASRPRRAYRCAHLVESFLQVVALLVGVVRIDALTLSSRFCRWQRFSSESCVSMRSPCRVVSAGGSASRPRRAYRCAHLVESFLQVAALLVRVVRIDALTLSSRFCRWQRFSSASCVSMRSPCRVVSAGGSASRRSRAYRCAHLVESFLQVAALLVGVMRIDALTLSSRFCRWQRFSSASCVSMRSPCRVVSAGGSASRRSRAYRCAHLVESFLQVAALLVRVVRIDALTLSSRFCRWQRFSSASCVSMRSPCRVVSAGGSASRRSSAYRCAHLVEPFLQVAALLVRVVRIDALTLSSRFCRWQRFSSESCVSIVNRSCISRISVTNFSRCSRRWSFITVRDLWIFSSDAYEKRDDR